MPSKSVPRNSQPRGAGPRPPSEQLAAIIRSSGRSAYELARLAGIDACMINRFLRGERDLHLSTLDKLAAVLGLDLVERTRARGRAGTAPIIHGEAVAISHGPKYDQVRKGSIGGPHPVDDVDDGTDSRGHGSV